MTPNKCAMHFLCLHGAGTNSRIFELQTAALRYELGGDHTYHFVDGVVMQPKARGVESLAPSDEALYAYYRPGCGESFSGAVADLARYLRDSGPFDGIIAFSQGTSLAAALLSDRLQVLETGIRCGIFFCGRPPFVDAGTPPPDASADKAQLEIRVPTAHIWGRSDDMEPGKALMLSGMCQSSNRHIYVHLGGHEVPGPRDKGGLVESANTIRSLLRQL